MKVKVGVIGLNMGKSHLVNYAKCKDAGIIAICDINRERLIHTKEEFNVPYAFEDYKELLSMEELDAVSIATPNYLHKPMTIDALRAGKHVLCEKPMALNVQEAREMTEEAKRANKKLMIHFNQRFFPECRFLKERIEKGELGEIYHVKTGWIRRGSSALGWIPTKYPLGWIHEKSLSGGGSLIDIGVHVLDLALWFLGHPKPKLVLGSTYTKFGDKIAEKLGLTFDVDDLASAYIKFDNGTSLFIEASWASYIPEEIIYTSLVGTEGGAERMLKGGKSSLSFFKEINGVDIDLTPNLKTKYYENPQEHFINCILQDREPLATGEDGVRVMEVLDAIYKSASIGKEVYL